jgi:recombination protein RecA
VEQGIVRKSGAWYTYEGDQLGQGKENARNFLRDNPDVANEIEKRIKEKLGVGARLDADTQAEAGTGSAPNGSAPNASGSGASGSGGSIASGAARPNGSAASSARPNSSTASGNGAPSSRPAATVPGATV